MISLRPIPYLEAAKYFVDFQKRSKWFEMPPETAQIIGIFSDKELAGYFIIQGYDKTDVEVNQGYLKKEYRHLNLPKDCMKLLEITCKKAGYKRMVFATASRFRSYLRFADKLGYKPITLEFSKEL